MNTLIEELRKFRDEYRRCIHPDNCSDRGADLIDDCIVIAMKHSDWIDVSVEPKKMTETESEAVLAIDENGYSYNVALADVTVNGIEKREWVETKAKWNGEFWEAVEYVCPAEGLVAYKHIPKPTSEVAV